ncbi:hypothetical protein, variant [Sphaeroforma arctica JP610]|uniref:T-box domain-containing protein n=1 Tax=Sphaeroforma arctica JP610 TaxID=667725 RepID=A0A0L0GA36_9EUKA|nr:hypothetical protein, variant [Sphaeroforma arctica JP610]KNC85774.1 hypothetical protein, variant [Sphaeroforma arctica JP610]|eukprot:XP_014159677.1 hypothetical protein, variant [Sphaeroforma arctica JP610]
MDPYTQDDTARSIDSLLDILKLPFGSLELQDTDSIGPGPNSLVSQAELAHYTGNDHPPLDPHTDFLPITKYTLPEHQQPSNMLLHTPSISDNAGYTFPIKSSTLYNVAFSSVSDLRDGQSKPVQYGTAIDWTNTNQLLDDVADLGHLSSFTSSHLNDTASLSNSLCDLSKIGLSASDLSKGSISAPLYDFENVSYLADFDYSSFEQGPFTSTNQTIFSRSYDSFSTVPTSTHETRSKSIKANRPTPRLLTSNLLDEFSARSRNRANSLGPKRGIKSTAAGPTHATKRKDYTDVHENSVSARFMIAKKTKQRRDHLQSFKDLQTAASVILQNGALWGELYTQTNEMITSSRGRQMFPVIKLEVEGLKSNALYTCRLYFFCEDSTNTTWRWCRVNHCWTRRSKGRESFLESNIRQPGCGEDAAYTHPEGAKTGKSWCSKLISFDKLRICNRPCSGDSKLQLSSFHKYTPIVYFEMVDESSDKTGINANTVPNSRVELRFPLPMCSFVTATTYHNKEVAKLKILANPMAKSQVKKYESDNFD